MKLRDIIGLIIALALAIGVAFLTRIFLAEEEKPKVEKPVLQQVELAKILVAGKPLSEGEVIKPGDIVWQSWPRVALNPTYIKEGTVKIQNLEGSIVRHPLDQGEPIIKQDLVKRGDQGILAAMVDPGKRAISIEVTPQSASSGLIIPGDYVDVILSKVVVKQGEAGSKSKTVVKNVKVLAMDIEMASSKPTPKIPPRVATLEVTPNEAELITAAVKEGTLSLSLQSIDRTKVESTEDEEPSKEEMITIIRGKEKSEVQVQEY